MISRRGKGYVFEKIAVDYLAPLGYNLISSNFTIRGGEIDLIFTLNDEIVFVEVKGFNFATPFDVYSSLSRKKLIALKRSINKWLIQNNKTDVEWRLDFIIILEERDSQKIEHFRNVDISTGSFAEDS